MLSETKNSVMFDDKVEQNIEFFGQIIQRKSTKRCGQREQ